MTTQCSVRNISCIIQSNTSRPFVLKSNLISNVNLFSTHAGREPVAIVDVTLFSAGAVLLAAVNLHHLRESL